MLDSAVDTMDTHSDHIERHSIKSGNCQISFIDFGSSDKPSLIMVHGMRDHGMSLVEVGNALSNDFHVIAVDLRGHGRSDNPGIYTMVQFVADVRAVVEHCQLEKPVVVGHSLGGHVASRYAAVFADEISKLVLLDGMGPPTWTAKQDAKSIVARWRMGVNAVAKMFYESRPMRDAEDAFERLRRNNPQISEALARTIVEHGVKPHSEGGVGWSFDPAVDMVWNTFNHSESEDIWRTIECPVLIVTGDRALDYWIGMQPDLAGQHAFYNERLEQRRQLFKNAQHKLIDNAGHMLHYDNPAQLNSVLLDFLRA